MNTDQIPETNSSGLAIVWGADAIAAEIGVTRRSAFYLLSRKQIPARKVGGRWCADRDELRAFFRNTGEAA